jgi:hypothetical protein
MELEAEIARLKERLEFVEHRPTIAAGLQGERILGSLVAGVQTNWSAGNDFIAHVGEIAFEVKFSDLNLAVRHSVTKRWTWHDPLGRRGSKVFDRLLLIGVRDSRVAKEHLPEGPYVFFDIPFCDVKGLIPDNKDAIQISTNPKTARTNVAKLLFKKYLTSPEALRKNYNI